MEIRLASIEANPLLHLRVRITYAIFLIALLASGSGAIATEPITNEQIRDAIEASQAFLQKEGRIWFNGENEYQEQGCVSCHQVPSAAWSLASSIHALDQPKNKQFQSLLEDALEHIADPKVGRPAMWSQLLISSGILRDNRQLKEEYLAKYLPEILKSQEEDGRWAAKGQFPSQRRPIKESDAVITMWMLRALEDVQSDDVDTARGKATKFLETVDGKSTEWLAWKSVTHQDESARNRLRDAQNDDGGWGWTKGEPSNAFTTGIVLFSIGQAPQGWDENAKQAGLKFLLDAQQKDGTWPTPSKLITKSGSDSLDYVYHYWSTAWAVIGLSQFHAYGST